MSQPTPFNRSFSFSNFLAANPSLPIPGSQVDIELNNATTSLDGVLTNLALIQRDDGALKNGTVTFDTLSPALQTAGLARRFCGSQQPASRRTRASLREAHSTAVSSRIPPASLRPISPPESGR